MVIWSDFIWDLFPRSITLQRNYEQWLIEIPARWEPIVTTRAMPRWNVKKKNFQEG